MRSNGLVRKSLAPAERARLMASGAASAVRTRIGRYVPGEMCGRRSSMTATPVQLRNARPTGWHALDWAGVRLFSDRLLMICLRRSSTFC